MPADNTEASTPARPTVFLSYASEDRHAAQVIRDALPAFGMEVWYDESDLVGGDAWDQKIRRQIRECDYFMPVISAHTEARHEGYFRREWRLAVERTLDMADDHVFLLPVVIDATAEGGARVPDKFRAVQWLRLPGGQPTPALEALCRRLVSGAAPPAGPAAERPRTTRESKRLPPESAGGTAAKAVAARELPPFPREEPGQRVRFWFQVAGWVLQCAWIGLQRLPRWVRYLIYVWLGILLISRCDSTRDTTRDRSAPPISATQEERLKDLAASHPGNWTAADTARLIGEIAKEIPAEAADDSAASAPVLAIPFATPPGDPAAQKLAGAVFTQLYGRLAIARHGHVTLADEPLPALDASAALAQGRARDSSYIVYGAVGGAAPEQQLTVRVVSTEDGSVSWSKSYPVVGADPSGIAAEVSAHVPLKGEDD